MKKNSMSDEQKTRVLGIIALIISIIIGYLFIVTCVIVLSLNTIMITFVLTSLCWCGIMFLLVVGGIIK